MRIDNHVVKFARELYEKVDKAIVSEIEMLYREGKLDYNRYGVSVYYVCQDMVSYSKVNALVRMKDDICISVDKIVSKIGRSDRKWQLPLFMETMIDSRRKLIAYIDKYSIICDLLSTWCIKFDARYCVMEKKMKYYIYYDELYTMGIEYHIDKDEFRFFVYGPYERMRPSLASRSVGPYIHTLTAFDISMLSNKDMINSLFYKIIMENDKNTIAEF